MIYRISNPSDPYTFEAPDLATAAIAMLFLGEWRYLGKPVDGGPETPFLPFGCTEAAMEAVVRELTGGTLEDFLSCHRAALAECLASVLIGSPSERETYQDAVSRMPEAEREGFRAARHDRMRSSMNDIGRRAQELATLFREEVVRG